MLPRNCSVPSPSAIFTIQRVLATLYRTISIRSERYHDINQRHIEDRELCVLFNTMQLRNRPGTAT